MKQRTKWITGVLASALLTVTALVAGSGAAQADASGRVSVEVCAEGNYTAYAKWVGNGLNERLVRVAAGTCGTEIIFLPQPNSSAITNVYLFGVYNISGAVFDVVRNGGPALPLTGDLTGLNKVLLRAQGTTTDPHVHVDAWGPGVPNGHVSGSA